MRAIRLSVATAFALAGASLMTLALAGGAFAQGRGPAAPAAASPATASRAAAGSQQEEAPLKQVALTDKLVENALAAEAEISPITDKLPEGTDPDAKSMAQIDAIAKKYGFANYADFDGVTSNINLVWADSTRQAKNTSPGAVIKNQIAEVQADKKMSPKEKKETLTELNESLKSTTPLQFPGNITVVTKYYDKLAAAMGRDNQ